MVAKFKHSRYQNKEMGWTCGTYGKQEVCIHVLGRGNLTKTDHLENTLKWYDNI